MKLIVLVALSAVVGSIASQKLAEGEWFAKTFEKAGTQSAVKVGMTAGIGALVFGLLNRVA